jgi:hypothetical protein
LHSTIPAPSLLALILLPLLLLAHFLPRRRSCLRQLQRKQSAQCRTLLFDGSFHQLCPFRGQNFTGIDTVSLSRLLCPHLAKRQPGLEPRDEAFGKDLSWHILSHCASSISGAIGPFLLRLDIHQWHFMLPNCLHPLATAPGRCIRHLHKI